jgi:hypothetical protein
MFFAIVLFQIKSSKGNCEVVVSPIDGCIAHKNLDCFTGNPATHLRFFDCCFASFSRLRFIQGFFATLSLPELP